VTRPAAPFAIARRGSPADFSYFESIALLARLPDIGRGVTDYNGRPTRTPCNFTAAVRTTKLNPWSPYVGLGRHGQPQRPAPCRRLRNKEDRPGFHRFLRQRTARRTSNRSKRCCGGQGQLPRSADCSSRACLSKRFTAARWRLGYLQDIADSGSWVVTNSTVVPAFGLPHGSGRAGEVCSEIRQRVTSPGRMGKQRSRRSLWRPRLLSPPPAIAVYIKDPRGA